MPAFEFNQDIADEHWLVKNLIPLGHLCTLLAQSGSGKSFLIEGLAVHVVYGIDFCGLETTAGDALIIDQDTPTPVLNKRIVRMAKVLGSQAKNKLYIESMKGYSLDSNKLPGIISNYNPRLVIIDSLHSLCGSRLNPNSTKDMSIWAKVKSQCLTEDRTIIVSHHITEKLSYTIDQLMSKDNHISGMGNSAIKQQADTEFILASSLNDNRIDKIYLRAIAKRQTIPERPVVIRMFEPDDTCQFEFGGYYEADLTECETDVLLLFRERQQEFTIKEVYESMGHKYGENKVREALTKLDKKSILAMGHYKSNLFKYRMPRNKESV